MDLDSPLAQFYVEHAASWSLVFCRVIGLFVFTPLLAGQSVPIRVRALVAAMMAVAVYAMLPDETRHVGPLPLGAYVYTVASEIFLGVSIGLIAGLPMIAVEIAGQVIGYQLGFAVAQASNPELDINLDAIGTMLFFLTLSVFFMMGGLDATLLAFLDTFGSLPAGGLPFADAPLAGYLGALNEGTELAIRIAAPVGVAVLLSMLAMGFVMRTVPQFNVMSVGFAIGILLGVFGLIMALFSVSDTIAEYIFNVIRTIERWIYEISLPAFAMGGGVIHA